MAGQDLRGRLSASVQKRFCLDGSAHGLHFSSQCSWVREGVLQVHKSRSYTSLEAQPGKVYSSLSLIYWSEQTTAPVQIQGEDRLHLRLAGAAHTCMEVMAVVFGVSLPQWVLYFFTRMRMQRLKNIICPR